jgi:acyl CoA:acetate/3-ketoacid CoA transferase alpha subunit
VAHALAGVHLALRTEVFSPRAELDRISQTHSGTIRNRISAAGLNLGTFITAKGVATSVVTLSETAPGSGYMKLYDALVTVFEGDYG